MADDEFKDPALKHYNRSTFIAKNTVMETVKGALVGALIGAAVLATFALAAPLLGLASIPFVGTIAAGGSLAAVVSGTAPAFVYSMLGSALTTGAMIGGGIGAVVKGGSALMHADERADDEENRLIAKSNQQGMRRQRAEMVERQRDMQSVAFQQQTMGMRGMNHNQGLPPMGGPGQHAHGGLI